MKVVTFFEKEAFIKTSLFLHDGVAECIAERQAAKSANKTVHLIRNGNYIHLQFLSLEYQSNEDFDFILADRRPENHSEFAA